MAETLANGTTIPQGSDPIHGSGVQAMRNLGGSVDGQLGNRYTKAQADALLAGKSPVGHTHDDRYYTEAETDALLSALDYNSGWRDVSGLLGEQYVSGEYWVKRVRNEVHLHFYQLLLTGGTGTSIRPGWSLPIGLRPSLRYVNLPFAGRSASYVAGPLRVSRYGVTDIYGWGEGRLIDADVSFDTEDTPLPVASMPGVAVTIF